MSMQPIDHVNIKIFASTSDDFDLGAAIPVFHRWIQDQTLDELLIDVADYRHVPAGPGVMLIGDAANYSLDLGQDQLGLLYNRKRALEGGFASKLTHAFSSALLAASLLESEPQFQGKLTFNAGQCEAIVNDRLLAPNNEETWKALEPALTEFFGRLFSGGDYSIRHVGEPRERFRVRVESSKFIPVQSLHRGVASSVSGTGNGGPG
jgi:hypothetical protein